MTEFKISVEGVKPVCSEGFNLSNKFVNYLKALRKTVKQFNCSTIQLVKAKAFTLAETLIVIGIIGVVAALTLPNLNHATGDKEKVTKVKKIYSALTDAVDRAQVVYGPMDEWFKDFNPDDSDGVFGITNNSDASELITKRITEFLKVSKECGLDEGCFSSAPYLDASGDVKWGSMTNYLSCLQGDSVYMVMLSDGTSLSFHAYKAEIHIHADIDGPNKGKNQEGNDIFGFVLGLQESGFDAMNTKYLQLIPDCANGGRGEWDHDYDLAKWVIENGNLDYLKCPDELNWETQTSCK